MVEKILPREEALSRQRMFPIVEGANLVICNGCKREEEIGRRLDSRASSSLMHHFPFITFALSPETKRAEKLQILSL